MKNFLFPAKFVMCSGNLLKILADPSGRAVYGVRLQPLDWWDRGYEAR
jgi:hypothetical protein